MALRCGQFADAGFDRHRDVEQWRVHLAAHDVGFTRAAAGPLPPNGELDGPGRIEGDKGDDPIHVDAVNFGDSLCGEGPAVSHTPVYVFVSKDDVEGDVVRTRVFAANRLGQIC